MLALRPWWRPALGRRRPSSDLRLLRSIGSPVPASSSSTSSSSNSASSTPAANNNDGGGVAGSGGAGGPRQGPLDRPRTAALRDWTAALGRSTLDRSRAGCDVRFDRSGGKGGQNVNKLNTKATLTVKLDQAHWISSELVPALKSSPYYAPTSHSLVLSGSAQRSQATNLADCFAKLRSHLLELARPLLPAETSAATRTRVEGLKSRFEGRVREDKMRRKELKAGRSTKGKRYDD